MRIHGLPEETIRDVWLDKVVVELSPLPDCPSVDSVVVILSLPDCPSIDSRVKGLNIPNSVFSESVSAALSPDIVSGPVITTMTKIAVINANDFFLFFFLINIISCLSIFFNATCFLILDKPVLPGRLSHPWRCRP